MVLPFLKYLKHLIKRRYLKLDAYKTIWKFWRTDQPTPILL
jgi:hypothetical protein